MRRSNVSLLNSKGLSIALSFILSDPVPYVRDTLPNSLFSDASTRSRLRLLSCSFSISFGKLISSVSSVVCSLFSSRQRKLFFLSVFLSVFFFGEAISFSGTFSSPSLSEDEESEPELELGQEQEHSPMALLRLQ